MKRKLMLGLLFVVMASTVAMAEVDRQGFWVGLGFLDSSIEGDSEDFDVTLPDAGDYSSSSSGWKISGGYRFMKYFGVEASWKDFGEGDDEVGQYDYTVNLESYDFRAVGFLPVGIFDFYASIGYNYWDGEATIEGGGNTAGVSDSSWDLSYGIGAKVTLAEHFGIHLEYDQYDIAAFNDVSSWTLGASWQF